LWVVHVLYGPDTWCARPTGHPVATINADSPERLIEEIRRQEELTRQVGESGLAPKASAGRTQPVPQPGLEGRDVVT
jgi:hypothetical protein